MKYIERASGEIFSCFKSIDIKAGSLHVVSFRNKQSIVELKRFTQVEQNIYKLCPEDMCSLCSIRRPESVKRQQLSLFFIDIMYSVTRLGDLLAFGQLFKAFGNN